MSKIAEDSEQADGRRWITEEHIDHLGKVYKINYLAMSDTDIVIILNNRVSVIEQWLIDNESKQAIDRVISGEDSLTMIFDYCTKKQATRKMILYVMAEKDIKVFLLLKPLIEYLKVTYTNIQLANWLNITVDQVTRIWNRYNAIIAIESILNIDDSLVEEIE